MSDSDRSYLLGGHPSELDRLQLQSRVWEPAGRALLAEPRPRRDPGQAEVIDKGFRAGGGNFNAGRELPSLLREAGIEPAVRAQIVAPPPGHPYLRLPLQFATSLRPRLLALIGSDGLDDLMRQAELELQRPGTWGTTFTLIPAHGAIS